MIWHIDTQSLGQSGIRTSDELYRLLSQHGRIAELEVYLSLSAAAVSFIRMQDAQKVCSSTPLSDLIITLIALLDGPALLTEV